MSDDNKLRICSRCHSTKLESYFGINTKGELYKLCDNCRVKGRVAYKNYRSDNLEKELERTRQYSIANTDKLREHARQRDAIIIQCECGASICYGGKSRHKQTKKHQELMTDNNNLIKA